MINCPRRVNSSKPITATKEVSFNMAINSLPSGGIMALKACGMIT